jgi:predicted DNA binding CopG/RHH family protein
MKSARAWVDPFAEMSDDEFDKHVEGLFTSRAASVAVSLRIAPDLIARVKREAVRVGVPYQTLMKSILEAGVAHLERRGNVPRRAKRR